MIFLRSEVGPPESRSYRPRRRIGARVQAGFPTLLTLENMAKTSTVKGQRGEQGVAHLTKSYRLGAQRTAPLQAGQARASDVILDRFPGLPFEVKRDERISVDQMVRQATAAVTQIPLEDGRAPAPCVAWRRNRGEWRADIPLRELFRLLAPVTN